MTPTPPEDSFHPDTIEEWHEWLASNAATSNGIWLISWRKPSGKAALPYEECVLEALCFGWIDSQQKPLDENRMMQRYTPRRKNSNWTAINKGRVARLIAEGRMMPAGQAEIDRAKSDGRWTLFDAVQALELPSDLAEALGKYPSARTNYDAFPPSTKQAILGWIATAKTEVTRTKRVETAAEMAQRNLRAFIDKPTDPARPVKTK